MTANLWEALPHFLEADASLFALVGTRMFPNRLEPGIDLPAFSYQDISVVLTQAHNEASALPRVRVQFTISAGTYSSAYAVTKALHARLDGYRGKMATGETFETEVQFCLYKNEFGNDDPELGIYQRFIDYIIQYKR
jgi:hypothetical protein